MTDAESPRFTYLGHSTVRCDLPSGEVLLIDPWVEGNPSCPDELKTFERIDAMLITHGHFDHINDAVELAINMNQRSSSPTSKSASGSRRRGSRIALE